MSLSPISFEQSKLLGCFTEKEYGKHFEYFANPELVLAPPAHGGRNTEFPHLIFVGPRGEETRMAKVLGNVVHVITDEDDDRYIIEKWDIKAHRVYSK